MLSSTGRTVLSFEKVLSADNFDLIHDVWHETGASIVSMSRDGRDRVLASF